MPRKIIYWVSLVILLLSAMVATGCFNEEKKARRYIKSTSGIEIPEDAEMVYNYRQSCFQERDRQYTLFRFENEPKEWLTENAFCEEKNTDFEEDFIRSLKGGHSETPISKEFNPDFDSLYFWLNVQETERSLDREFFVYFPNQLKLIVYIN